MNWGIVLLLHCCHLYSIGPNIFCSYILLLFHWIETFLQLEQHISIYFQSVPRPASSLIENCMTTISNLQKSIEICEARLQQCKAQQQEEDEENEEYWVYPAGAQTLYHQLLGNAYLKMYQELLTIEGSREKERTAIADKCMEVLEKGMELASGSLQIVDPVRLLLSYTYCEALILLKNKQRKAKIVAEKVFELATSHIYDISDSAMVTLQHLRDHFMILNTDNVQIVHAQDCNIESEMQEIATMFQERKKSVKFREIENIRSQRMAQLGSPGTNKRVMLAKNLRRIVSLPVPVMLETITSASHILKALDRLFRAYVRGNALPGQQSGGQSVDLAGHTMTFRTFVLHGPYMSWRGFVSFLLDFAIVKLPDEQTRSGKHFFRSMNSSALLKSIAARKASGPDPLVDMIEAAMIFMESSHSTTPALVLSKYMKLYAEIANSLESDPWNYVYEWAEFPSSDEWEIPVGINFMQFVDCLGKLGAIAYSSGTFAEMLPTVSDKIEHFLSAYMGLSDHRRWQGKVDSKLKHAKNFIKQLSESKRGRKFGRSKEEKLSPQRHLKREDSENDS